MTAGADTSPSGNEKLVALERLVVETGRLIDEQVCVVRSAEKRGESDADANHSLELMIELQVGQIVELQQLKRSGKS